MILTPAHANSKKAVGWHWYNEIYVEKKEDKKRTIPDQLNNKSKITTAIEEMELLRQAVQEAKARAVLYPTIENMRSYLVLQNYVIGKASLFTQTWKRTLLAYPDLDYAVLHPTQTAAQHVLSSEVYKKESEAIRFFSKTYGLFFFYRGNNPLDQALAPTIEEFSRQYGISLIPITMDGSKLEIFATNEKNETDRGQAEKLGIKYFPALVLVDPKNQKVVPLNYGFTSGTDLRRRFLQVITGFQEGV